MVVFLTKRYLMFMLIMREIIQELILVIVIKKQGRILIKMGTNSNIQELKRVIPIPIPIITKTRTKVDQFCIIITPQKQIKEMMCTGGKLN